MAGTSGGSRRSSGWGCCSRRRAAAGGAGCRRGAGAGRLAGAGDRSRILCAASLADGCGDEPALIAAYGTEVGKLVREHMPMIAFEEGSRAVPVDFRRCRSTACGDGSARGLVHRTDAGLPVSAFVHVVDCRPGAAERSEAEGDDCSGDRAGNLYLQYWTYYADSATLRGVPIVGDRGLPRRRLGGRADPHPARTARSTSAPPPTTATTTPGASPTGARTPGSTRSRTLAEAVGARAHNGWGPETHLLLVSGGSHAGNAIGIPRRRPLHPRPPRPPDPARADRRATAATPDFAISAPWRSASGATPRPKGPAEATEPLYPCTWSKEGSSLQLLRRHPQGAVEADRLAVQHRVGDDLADQPRVLLGPAEAGGEGDAGAERLRAPPPAGRPAAGCRRARGRSSRPERRARPCRAPPAGSCRRCRPSRPSRRSGRSVRRRRRSRRC